MKTLPNKKILFVCDELPFEVKNGVTAASHTLLRTLIFIFKYIDILIIDKKSPSLIFDYRGGDYSKAKINLKNININRYNIVFSSHIKPSLKVARLLNKKSNVKFIPQLSDCNFYALWRTFILGFRYGKPHFSDLIKLMPYYLMFAIRKFNGNSVRNNRRKN